MIIDCMIDTDNIIIAYFSCLFAFLFTRMGGSRKVKFSVPRSWKDTAGGKQKIWCFSGLEPHNQTKYCFRDVAWLLARITLYLIIQNTRAFSTIRTYWRSETHNGNWKIMYILRTFFPKTDEINSFPFHLLIKTTISCCIRHVEIVCAAGQKCNDYCEFWSFFSQRNHPNYR